jgi:hypothetical protein
VIALLCVLFAPALVAVLAPGLDAEPAQYAVGFVRLAAPYLAIVGLVAVLAATLNAAGHAGTYLQRGDRRRLVCARLCIHKRGQRARRPPSPAAFCNGSWSASRPRGLPTRHDGRPAHGSTVFQMLPGGRRRHPCSLIVGTIVALVVAGGGVVADHAYRLWCRSYGVGAIAAVMTPAIAARIRADDRRAFAANNRAFELARPRFAGGALRLRNRSSPACSRGAFSARDSAAVASALAAIAVAPGQRWRKCQPRYRSRVGSARRADGAAGSPPRRASSVSALGREDRWRSPPATSSARRCSVSRWCGAAG